jgi:hypothetical protein
MVIASGVALEASIILTGSPGIRWISAKATRVIRISTGMAWTIRRPMYVNIGVEIPPKSC